MAYADVVLADSPWAYWVCDDASGLPQDSSGNARHMTALETHFDGSAPLYEEPTVLLAEPAGKSIKSDLNRWTLPVLNLTDQNFALECWLKIDTLTEGIALWGQGSLGSTNRYIYTQLFSDGRVRFSYFNADLDTTPGLVEVGDYVHLVFRRDHAADLSSIWLDGVKVAESAIGPKIGTSDRFIWGDIPDRTSQYFGHLAVYLTALDDTRIVEHFNAGAGTEPPSVTCDVQGTTSITVGITPTVGADNHEIYVSTDPAFTPDSDSLIDPSLGPSPSSFEVTGLDAATTYYVIVRAIVGSFTLDSSTLECATTTGGAAPAFVSVIPTGTTTAEFRPFPEDPSVVRAYYEWRLASDPDWSTPIGSTSDASASRFIGQGTGLTPDEDYIVRARYEYIAGLSAWTEAEWTQPSIGTVAAGTAGVITDPTPPFISVASPFPVEWQLNAGWSALALEASTDGTSWAILQLSPSTGYTIDPTVYADDSPLFIRLQATNGTITTYLYAAVIIDLDNSRTPVPLGPVSSTWLNALALGSGIIFVDPVGNMFAMPGGGLATLLAPGIQAGDDGFKATFATEALASGNTRFWWMNEEVESAFMGIEFRDEDGHAWLSFGARWGSRYPITCSLAAPGLEGNMLVTASLSHPSIIGGSGTFAGGTILSGGTWCCCVNCCGNCCGSVCGTATICPGTAAMDVEIQRISGDTYSWNMRVATTVGGIFVDEGTINIVGGLPCGYITPTFGRFTSNFIGYVSAGFFAWSPIGVCSDSLGLPSGAFPVEPLTASPITCDVNCDCVTITPEPLALTGATQIKYEVTTSDDEYFDYPIVTDGYRAVNPILADEVSGPHCLLSAGHYIARYSVLYGSSGAEEVSEICEFTIIELGVVAWAGWRTAADLGNEAPVAAFSYAVLSGAVVQFTDASFDIDGTIDEWLWQFKDAGVIVGTSTEQNPTFDFGAVSGDYSATLTVVDDDFDSDSVTETVSI